MSGTTKAKPRKKPQDKAAKSLKKIAAELDIQMPDEVKKINASRAKKFLAILDEIGIGDIINSVVQQDKKVENTLKPITANDQMAAAGAGMREAKEIVKNVQMNIDYAELTKRLLQDDVFERMICVVLDIEDAEDGDLGRFGSVFPFFLSRFSRIYSGLTSFIVQSV